MARLVLLSGPSCVGKGPLVSALERHHPELATQLVPLVLHNSRAPRPGEVDGVDYHFRPRAEIERLVSSPGFVAGDVRGDFQGLELATIDQALEMIDFQASKKGIALENCYEKADSIYLIHLYGDKNRYLQIILNFLSNAIKFTPKNGNIKVQTVVNETQDKSSSYKSNEKAEGAGATRKDNALKRCKSVYMPL